ncbi:MAG TPA: hypothetical protein VE954_16780 [Oligoflexus sp.]|nr:hypothetical protein [Oligoflexus sp.]HYX34755.1 hypothetical protein [Oligoflexus sp.]
MNVILLAFVFQILGLYAMILLSDYVIGMVSEYRAMRRLKKNPLRIRR